MRVLHVGPRPDVGEGNGVDVATWPLISAQVDRGAKVAVLVMGKVDPRAHAEAARRGVRLEVADLRRLLPGARGVATLLDDLRPDIVHLHSVFLPAHALLAGGCRARGVAYVVTPHGGLNLFRNRGRKEVYGALIEKPYLRRAACVFALTERERGVLGRWLSARLGRCVVLPNPLAPAPSAASWAPPAQLALTYVGRYDVQKKGLDRLVDLATRLPEVSVHAFGSATGSECGAFRALVRRGLPRNMTFQAPVYGTTKRAVVAAASLYIHLARNEGFGMSIVEAMQLGVPVAVAEECDLADQISAQDLGLVLPPSAEQAADVIRRALADPSQLAHWSRRGQKWVRQELGPDRLASVTLGVYESVVDVPSRRPRRPADFLPDATAQRPCQSSGC
jgi:glycosyltransferase involved in cell wall biosynthesis